MFSRKENSDKPQEEAAEQTNENQEKEVVEKEVFEQESAQAQLTRLSADFQNYKKRVEKDRTLWMNRSRMDLLLPLLAVVDDFDRALEDAQKQDEQEAFAQWVQGFEMIRKALYDYLAKQHVTVIEQVQTFDPMLHEAVMQVPSEEHESGAVVQVMQRGFMFKDQVLRTAKVSVAQ